VTAHLVPRRRRCKQLLFLATLILAGCGGSSAPEAQVKLVRGPGFRFEAPRGWRVERTQSQVSASRDSELVRVALFPLVKPYTPALFTRVEGELEARMTGIARQSRGTISGRQTVTAAGIRSHAYDVTVGDHVDQYTFVLAGLREYQLLCRRKASSDASFCETLQSSFVRSSGR
jgi:predicted Zn-dependent protease